MNTNVNTKVQRVDKKNLYISLGLFLLDLLFFILIKSNVFESTDFSIQESLQPDHTNNKITTIPTFLKIIHYFNKILFPYSIIIIVNNFSSIYITFILFSILSLCCYISSILKFIFYTTIINPNGIIYYCGDGWNLPCTEILISVLFYLSLWNISFKGKESRKKRILKNVFLVLIIVINIINAFCLATIGYYLFSHIIFSAILGVLIYVFIFETNIIKEHDPKEFCSFIKNKFEKYMIYQILLLVITFIPYIIERNVKDNKKDECKSIDNHFYHKNKSEYITYVDDTFALISIFFGHFFVAIGIKCELVFVFRNHIQNFEQYHFGVNLDELNMERELKNNTGTIIVTTDTEWNNTIIIKSIIRLIITFALSFVSFLPYFSMDKNEDIDFSKIFLVKYSLSFALFSFGITFCFKFVFKVLKLSNEILGSILNDQ